MAMARDTRHMGRGAVSDGVVSDRIWTIPNLLSFLRLALVPVFLWLILGPEADGLAIVVLLVSGATDWLDGYIARATGQLTRLGALLDPLADRLYILATLIGLLLRDIVPVWIVVALIARDVVLAAFIPALRRRGIPALPVHFIGKAATMNLLYAFPLLLLSDGTGTLASVAFAVGWAFALWGTCLYWYAGLLYVIQAKRILALP
jgi:cardiolipin synthase (CMP-forming)